MHKPKFKIGDRLKPKHPNPYFMPLGTEFVVNDIVEMITSCPFYSGVSDKGCYFCGWESDLRKISHNKEEVE